MQEIIPNWRYKVIFNNQIESIPHIMTTSKAQSLSKLTIWKIENAQKSLEAVASCPQNLSPKIMDHTLGYMDGSLDTESIEWMLSIGLDC